MDEACGAYGRQETCIQGWGGGGCGGLRERVHLEDLSVDGRKILKRIFKKWNAGMDWIVRAKDRDRWPALVRMVISCGFRKMQGIS
jgi:hypothetical protein